MVPYPFIFLHLLIDIICKISNPIKGPYYCYYLKISIIYIIYYLFIFFII